MALSLLENSPDTADKSIPLSPGVSWRVFDSQLSVTSAIEAKFPVGHITAGNEGRVLVREVSRSVETTNGGQRERWGTALRLVIVAQGVTIEGQFTLPVIAAKAELNLLSATCELLLVGYDDNKVWGMIPPLGQLGVDTLPKYTAAIDRVQQRISENPAGITPARLEVLKEEDEEVRNLARYAARLQALEGIARGRSGERYTSDLDHPEFARRVRAQWELLDAASATTSKPSTEAQVRADRQLRAAYS